MSKIICTGLQKLLTSDGLTTQTLLRLDWCDQQFAKISAKIYIVLQPLL